MLRAIPLTAVLLTAAPLAAMPANAETRCGWYHNNTSANIYLQDADDLWVIFMQGIVSTPVAEDAYPPDFHDRIVMDYGGRIVSTQYAKHGFSCACVEGEFGEVGSGKVASIARFSAPPFAQCKDDPRLPKVELSGQ
jgi:hypothetical protein